MRHAALDRFRTTSTLTLPTMLVTPRLAVALAASAIIAMPSLAEAQSSAARARSDAPATSLLPFDSNVVHGTLANGLQYFVRRNAKPEKRAELRLVVRVGSVLEDEDQRGLAHFVEHMAFNGTKRFAKNEIVNYLERIGMRFGADINAYTNFDETVYMLQIPTDTASIVSTGLDILREWATALAFDSSEVSRERGVVVEEWRLGRGAGARMSDKQIPIILHGSRYAARLPIGVKQIIETAPAAAMRRFYNDWYRPDLMSVVAVGDFEPAAIVRQIRERFGSLHGPAKERPRVAFALPDEDTTLVAIATDKEATRSSVSVMFKTPHIVQRTVGQYRESIVVGLFTQMLNQRFDEITDKPDAPFVNAYTSKGQFFGGRDAFTLSAGVNDGAASRGLRALLTEAERVQRFGFTQPELDRAKTNLLRAFDQIFAERDKTESSAFADELVRHVTDDESVPGVAAEFALHKRFVPTVRLDEVNALVKRWIVDRNRIVVMNGPEKPGVTTPSASDLLATFRAIEKEPITAYTDAGASGALMDAAPQPGRIVETSEVKEAGVTRWTLSNGVRVVMKPTDFQADQVLVHGYASGGWSLLTDAQFAKAREAATLVTEGGVGRFNRTDLQKVLTGKAVNVSPSIGELSEDVFGQASPKDVESLFQLTYLYFTAPRADSAAVLAFKQRVRPQLANRGASPEAAFSDTLGVTLTNHHPWHRPVSTATLDSLDLGASLAFYKERFADASGFTFVFVGNLTPDSIKPFVLAYLGALPSLGRKDHWRDIGVIRPTGVVQKDVRRGTEPKAQTQLVFGGPLEWSRENRYALSSLQEVLTIRLREVLREALSGTYGVQVNAGAQREPAPRYDIGIRFTSAPERAESLRQAVFVQIDSLKRTGATDDEVAKVREIQRRGEETDLKRNEYWLDALVRSEREGEDPRTLLQRQALRATLSSNLIREAARRFLNEGSYVQVRLLPEP